IPDTTPTRQVQPSVCATGPRRYGGSAMAKIFSVVTKAGLSRILDPVARVLLRAGVSPDAVTVAGTAGVVVAAIVLATRGRLIAATLVITACALLDVLDGAMARLSGRSSRFGALLDSTMDRVA